eukprot:1556916-Ditylum_brightwellii.AAC.1
MYRKYKATLEALTTFTEMDTLLWDLPDSASVTSSHIIGNNIFCCAGLIWEQQNTGFQPQSFDQFVHILPQYMKRELGDLDPTEVDVEYWLNKFFGNAEN